MPRHPRHPALRRTASVSALATATLVGIAACGSTSGSSAASTAKLAPPAALTAGVHGVEAGKAATFTLKLDATAAQLSALDKASGDTGSSNNEVQIVPGGSVVLTVTAVGKSFAADGANASASAAEPVAVTVNGGGHPDLVQFDLIDKIFYARADVKTLTSIFSSPAGAAELQQYASSGAGSAYPFVGKALAGDWIKLDLGDLASFAQGIEPGKVPSVSGGQFRSLEQALAQVETKDVTVSRAGQDPTLGDHLVLTGDTTKIGDDLLTAVKSTAGTVPQISTLLGRADTTTLPSKTVTVDAYVKGGVLDAVKLNVTPFLSAAESAAVQGAPIYVELDIAGTGTVSAPSDATTVSTAQLIGLFAGIERSEGSSETGTASATATPVA